MQPRPTEGRRVQGADRHVELIAHGPHDHLPAQRNDDDVAQDDAPGCLEQRIPSVGHQPGVDPLDQLAQAEILIATAGPMTGVYAWAGQRYQRGAAMAVDDLNANGPRAAANRSS